MTIPPPDGSRDRRIEDPTNLWIVHLAGRLLLPWFMARGISANAVSLGGLGLGVLAAIAYANWHAWPFAVLGLLLSVGWLIADGLDGMIARAAGTASPLGRFLDGLCDHGVFILIYVVLATSIGTSEGWILACSAGLFHGLQSNLYEGERARFHRRVRGLPAPTTAGGGNALVRGYDRLAGSIGRFSRPLDAALGRGGDSARLVEAYGAQAARPLLLMSLLTANARVSAIFLACLAGNPRLFWWFELVPLTAILVIGLCWHRVIELRLVRGMAAGKSPQHDHFQTKDVTQQ